MKSTLKTLLVFTLLTLLTADGAYGFFTDHPLFEKLTGFVKKEVPDSMQQFAVEAFNFAKNHPFTKRFLAFIKRDEPENINTIKPIEGATSGATTELQGYFRIVVVGTGKACYVKEFRDDFGNTQQFGEFANSDAFLKFFGEPECEVGDVGFAWGKVKASVVAAAYEKGEECLTKVLSSVIIDPFHQYSKGDVSIRISGEADGEAVALCEEPETK